MLYNKNHCLQNSNIYFIKKCPVQNTLFENRKHLKRLILDHQTDDWIANTLFTHSTKLFDDLKH